MTTYAARLRTSRKWHQTHRAESRQYRRERAKAHRAIVANLKSKPCQDCGLTYPSYVMDFDHVRGTKLFNIATSVTRSLTSLMNEILKCDVVCSNCHRIRTYNRTK